MATNWREEQKAELKQRLYEIALDLFRERGYESTTVQLITERAGVAKGTFFNHFPGKEHVLATWYRHLTLDALAEVQARRFSGAEKAILALMDGLARRAEDEAELLAMKTRAPVDLLSEEERVMDAALAVYCTKKIAEGKKTGEFDADVDARLFASLIVATLTGTGRTWVLTGPEFNLRKNLKRHISFLFRAVRTKKPQKRGMG